MCRVEFAPSRRADHEAGATHARRVTQLGDPSQHVPVFATCAKCGYETRNEAATRQHAGSRRCRRAQSRGVTDFLASLDVTETALPDVTDEIRGGASPPLAAAVCGSGKVPDGASLPKDVPSELPTRSIDAAVAVAHLLWMFDAISPGPVGGRRVASVREAIDASVVKGGTNRDGWSAGRYYPSQLIPALADLGLVARRISPNDYDTCRWSGVHLLVVRGAPNFVATRVMPRHGSSKIEFSHSPRDWGELEGKACRVALAGADPRWGIYQGLARTEGEPMGVLLALVVWADDSTKASVPTNQVDTFLAACKARASDLLGVTPVGPRPHPLLSPLRTRREKK